MSNQNTEQYRDFIGRLQREEHRPAALNDIKTYLLFKPDDEALFNIQESGISKIVQCLNDKAQIDLTCEVLKICFEKFQAGDVVKNYTSHIMYLLRHEKSCVRRLAIDEVYKAVTKDANLLPIPAYIDVFVATAQLVADEDVGIANEAILITSNLPVQAYSKVLDEMKIGLEYTSSSKCNVFEVIVNISSRSFELFQLAVNLNYIDFMVAELHTDDVLYQVNILDLLSRLAVTPHGISYLVKNGALLKISEYVAALPDNPLSALLLPGYMKFFGAVAHHYPREILEKYPVFSDQLFEALESGDQSIYPVTLDTLGFIGTTIEGKLCLAAVGSKYTQTVNKVSQLIRNGNTEIKIRALHCFASLIAIDQDPAAPKSGPVDHRVTLMTREWFRTLSVTPMETLCEICRNPFPDIRLPAFALLDAVCQHQWGEELVARTAGFIEFLLDRSVAYTKEENEAKYDIIKRLATSAAFDASTIDRLQTYIEQGPFYAESILGVAMDEGEN